MHSQVKSASKACSSMIDLKAARGRCHSDFKGCDREILNGGPGCVTPTLVRRLLPLRCSYHSVS